MSNIKFSIRGRNFKDRYTFGNRILSLQWFTKIYQLESLTRVEFCYLLQGDGWNETFTFKVDVTRNCTSIFKGDDFIRTFYGDDFVSQVHVIIWEILRAPSINDMEEIYKKALTK